jgi:4-aminobutyrate--pyruvate transaminase
LPPVCCAAALASIRVIRRDRLVERSAESGRYFRERLDELTDLPIVGSVRSLGLMLGVVFTQDDGTPANPRQRFHVFAALHEAGIMAYLVGNTLAFCPALVITNEEIDTIVGRLRQVLSNLSFRDGKVATR